MFHHCNWATAGIIVPLWCVRRMFSLARIGWFAICPFPFCSGVLTNHTQAFNNPPFPFKEFLFYFLCTFALFVTIQFPLTFVRRARILSRPDRLLSSFYRNFERNHTHTDAQNKSVTIGKWVNIQATIMCQINLNRKVLAQVGGTPGGLSVRKFTRRARSTECRLDNWLNFCLTGRGGGVCVRFHSLDLP